MTEHTDTDGEKTQADRRRGFRAPLIILQVKVEEGKRVFFGYAKNLSRGGLFIASANPREPDSRFNLEFSLPDKKQHVISCDSRVVWKRDYSPAGLYEPGMGLQFLDLTDEDAALIREWVDKAELE